MFKLRVLPVLLCLPVLAGCSGAVNTRSSDKINVVCTVYPQYDWAREIIGDAENVQLTLLVDNGADFHSYQPGTDDMVTLASCDVLIYIGGNSDKWVQDSLANAANQDMQTVNLTEILGNSIIEEVCTIEDEEHDHEHDHDHEEHTYDEHVWLSLKNAKLFCSSIADALCSADPENAQSYKANAEAYIEKLDELDAKYKETVECAAYPRIIFADRFPFIYMMQDYDIEYYAAFPGCSSETDASFETVLTLAEAVDRTGVMGVFTIDGSNSSIAEAVLSNTENGKGEIYTLNSMQSVSREDIDGGCTYLSIMEENLSEIREAMYIHE
ncbi:MAG: zinc ABC transporter substrate-binding protein [Oscillospiraceae bacterium]|nr:zinc ABC transporter substrate-binding protein [Oscillospiraceae bacterium]